MINRHIMGMDVQLQIATMTLNSKILTSVMVHELIESQTGLISIFFLIFVHGTASKSPIAPMKDDRYAYYGYECTAIYIYYDTQKQNPDFCYGT